MLGTGCWVPLEVPSKTLLQTCQTGLSTFAGADHWMQHMTEVFAWAPLVTKVLPICHAGQQLSNSTVKEVWATCM